MVFSSIQAYLDPSNWQPQPLNHHHLGESGSIPTPHLPPPTPPAAAAQTGGVSGGGVRPNSMAERARLANVQIPDAALKCPRCESTNTKFCYFNNYSLSQPRHFCKTCKRYWTRGGALRSVPVGGGCRRNNKRSSKGGGGGGSSNSSCSKSTTTTTSSVGNDHGRGNISCGGPSMSSAASAVVLAPQIHHHLPFTAAQLSDDHRHPLTDAGENMMMTLHLGGRSGGENYLFPGTGLGGVASLLSSSGGGIQQPPPPQFSFFDPLYAFHQPGFESSPPPSGFAGFRPRVPPSTFVQPAPTVGPVKTEDGDDRYRNYHDNVMAAMMSSNPNPNNNNNVGVFGMNNSSIVVNTNEQWCNWSDIHSASFSSSSTSNNNHL